MSTTSGMSRLAKRISINKVFLATQPQMPHKNSTTQRHIFLGLNKALRFWPQTCQKFQNDLQGSTKIKGFGPKPPKSYAMPNTVI